VRWFPLAAAAVLSAALLAGCATKGSNQPLDGAGAGAPQLQVDQQTGGIRGVVVDAAITPIAGAKVVMANGALSTTSDKAGLFKFSGLKPGDYFFTVSKAGYTTVQATATVHAGDAAPPVVKVEIDFIPGKQPYIEVFKLNGFYECTFATVVDVDSCDMAVRTAYDAYNSTEHSAPPAIPRHVMQYENTQFIPVANDVQSIVQEGFWTDDTVSAMQIVIDSTPIDPVQDNSAKEFLHAQGGHPTYGRLDNNTVPVGQTVAARGFLPFQTQPAVATNFQFTVITTLFHNYQPPKEWTFATQDKYPIGN
jgi:hypothetical protein